MRTDEAVEAEEDRQIVTTRVIDGPRHLVFRAWTDVGASAPADHRRE
jgi:hypothetical protein